MYEYALYTFLTETGSKQYAVKLKEGSLSMKGEELAIVCCVENFIAVQQLIQLSENQFLTWTGVFTFDRLVRYYVLTVNLYSGNRSIKINFSIQTNKEGVSYKELEEEIRNRYGELEFTVAVYYEIRFESFITSNYPKLYFHYT